MSRPIDRLIAIMARLRDPERGCPWDVEQTFATIAPHTIEEAYEVADAIQRGAMDDLKDELGDLLLQVVFHARMAEEAGRFAFEDVAAAIADKLVRRHPHVFGTETVESAAAQTAAWEDHKARERAAKAGPDDDDGAPSALAGVPVGLPALTRAVKLQKRAARVGFDWAEPAQVLEKIAEETAEIAGVLAGPSVAGPGPDDRRARLADEMGDLLFACANLARKLDLDPETALRAGNAKFERRFRAMERAAAAEGRDFAALPLTEQEALWQQVKRDE